MGHYNTLEISGAKKPSATLSFKTVKTGLMFLSSMATFQTTYQSYCLLYTESLLPGRLPATTVAGLGPWVQSVALYSTKSGRQKTYPK